MRRWAFAGALVLGAGTGRAQEAEPQARPWRQPVTLSRPNNLEVAPRPAPRSDSGVQGRSGSGPAVAGGQGGGAGGPGGGTQPGSARPKRPDAASERPGAGCRDPGDPLCRNGEGERPGSSGERPGGGGGERPGDGRPHRDVRPMPDFPGGRHRPPPPRGICNPPSKRTADGGCEPYHGGTAMPTPHLRPATRLDPPAQPSRPPAPQQPSGGGTGVSQSGRPGPAQGGTGAPLRQRR